MSTPHGPSLAELLDELGALEQPKSPTVASLAAELAQVRAIALELARLVIDQDIPSRSRGLAYGVTVDRPLDGALILGDPYAPSRSDDEARIEQQRRADAENNAATRINSTH